MTIDKDIRGLLPWMTEKRRFLHQIPEPCYQEHKTSAFIQETLGKLGLPFNTVGTGVVVRFEGKAPTRTIGFRADIDGLAIQEKFESDFKSKHDGFMHACGHDGHAAVLLGFAKYLAKNQPRDNTVLVFQPAEEGGLGAQKMIESGLVDADIYYALHIDPNLGTGRFSTRHGEMMAGGAPFEIVITGRTRHASLGDGTQDAIRAAVALLSRAEQSLNSPKSIFQAGMISGGTAVNIIADKTTIKGSMRFLSENVFKGLKGRLKTIIDRIEKEGTGNIKLAPMDKYIPPLINSRSACNPLYELKGFEFAKPTFASEDFALFTKKYSGAMIWLGAKPKEVHPLHSDMFNFDENAMMHGVQLFKELSNAKPKQQEANKKE